MDLSFDKLLCGVCPDLMKQYLLHGIEFHLVESKVTVSNEPPQEVEIMPGGKSGTAKGPKKMDKKMSATAAKPGDKKDDKAKPKGKGNKGADVEVYEIAREEIRVATLRMDTTALLVGASTGMECAVTLERIIPKPEDVTPLVSETDATKKGLQVADGNQSQMS